MSLKGRDLTGKTLKFSAYRRDNELIDTFPVWGRVLGYYTLSSVQEWMLIHLDRVIKLKGVTAEHALIKRPVQELLRLNSDNQLVHFKLVPHIGLLQNYTRVDDYPTECWALCR